MRQTAEASSETLSSIGCGSTYLLIPAVGGLARLYWTQSQCCLVDEKQRALPKGLFQLVGKHAESNMHMVVVHQVIESRIST